MLAVAEGAVTASRGSSDRYGWSIYGDMHFDPRDVRVEVRSSEGGERSESYRSQD